MNTIFGNNAIAQLKIDGDYVSVGCTAGFTFQFTNELIFKTDVNAGLNRKRRAKMSDSHLSLQGLFTIADASPIKNSMYLLEEGIRRSEQDWRLLFTDEGGASKQIQGLFIMESYQTTGKADDWSEFDIELAGTGDIAISDPEDTDSDLPGDVQFDWWQKADGDSTVTGTGHFGRSFAGESILQVRVEGSSQELDTGSGRKYQFDGTTVTLGFPVSGAARVYVLWKNI